MLMDFKLDKQVFGGPGVDLVVGGGRPYGKIVLDYIHEIRIEMRIRHDDKVGG